MLRELIELGRRLERDGRLPPPGFYGYSEPIRWIVEVDPSVPARADLKRAELALPRPFDGRTSGVSAHPLVDEAAYALGVADGGDGKSDDRAEEKHDKFVALLEKVCASPIITDQPLREGVTSVLHVLRDGTISADERFGEIRAKDWVSFAVANDPIVGRQLFDYPEARKFWVEESRERKASHMRNGDVREGQCGVCGRWGWLTGSIGQGVKIAKPVPFASQNENAFVSFQYGPKAKDYASVGMCWDCADLVTRALNELSSGSIATHRVTLVRDKKSRESLRNQIAFFWLKDERPIQAGTERIDGQALVQALLAPMAREAAPAPTSSALDAGLAHLERLLKVPWTATDRALRLDQNAFYLLVLSPNVGRVAVRDWIAVSLGELHGYLARFLDAVRVVDPSGRDVSAFPIRDLLEAIDSTDVNMARGMLRTAYVGYPPPGGLLEQAVSRFRAPDRPARTEKERRERARRRHVLIMLIKLALTHGKEDAVRMQQLDTDEKNPAYLCGRLLAVLGQVQEEAQGYGLNTTVIERFYGAASTSPDLVFGRMVVLAQHHLEKLRSAQTRGKYVNLQRQIEEIMGKLPKHFPTTLTPAEQGRFALGYYQQRAQRWQRRSGNAQGNTMDGEPAEPNDGTAADVDVDETEEDDV